MCPEEHEVRPKGRKSTRTINLLNITNDEKQKENRVADQFCRGRDASQPDAPRTDPYVQDYCIRLLPRMDSVEAHVRMRMQDLRTRNPAVDQTQEPLPSQPTALASSPKRTVPAPDDLSTEAVKTIHVPGYCMVVEVTPYNRLQPGPGRRDGFMPTASELLLELIELGGEPLPDGLTMDDEGACLPGLPTDVGVSRPAELHHRPLAEPSVRLSPHSAPIRQTCRSSGLSVARIEVLLVPVASVMRPPDPTPSLQPRYELSPLLRVGPPQCSASVRSPHGCDRLGFSLNIRATGSCSSAQQPASASRPLYAGRRPLSHQASRGLVPGGLYARGFDDTYFLNDASSKGSLSFVSRMLTCTGLYPRFSSNAHHHGSLPQQLGSVWDLLLKADPEGPSLIYCAACHAHGYLVHGELLIRVLLQHTKTEEVKHLWFSIASLLPVFGCVTPEFD